MAGVRRSSVLPELPTLAEQGLPELDAAARYALMMPSGTPADLIARTASAASHWLAQTETRDQFAARGLEVDGSSPEMLAATLRDEAARWAEVIRRQNIKLE